MFVEDLQNWKYYLSQINISVMIYFATFETGIQRYNKNKLCKNHEVETNQRQKQPITILSKKHTPAN